MTTHLLWDSAVVPDFILAHERVCGWTQLHVLGAIDKYLLCLLNYVSRILLESPQRVIQHTSHQAEVSWALCLSLSSHIS